MPITRKLVLIIFTYLHDPNVAYKSIIRMGVIESPIKLVGKDRL